MVWLGAALAFLLAQLPYRWLRWLGHRLGDLLGRLDIRRARVARTNIALCFPDLSAVQQAELHAKHMRAVGFGFFETIIAWFGSRRRLRRRFRVEGLENLDACGDSGIILLGMHFTNIEIACILLASVFPISGIYRPHDNAAMERIQTWGRLRGAASFDGKKADLIDRAEARQIVKRLRNGGRVWLAADQDLGKLRSVFAPFFGVQAATPIVASKLAKASNARVLPVTFHHQGSDGYVLSFGQPLDGFPTGDDVADATRFNKVVEGAVREEPEAYLWVHRRFKTRPQGEAPIYS